MPEKHTLAELTEFAHMLAEAIRDGAPLKEPTRTGRGDPGASTVVARRLGISVRAVHNRRARAAAAGLAAIWEKEEAKRVERLPLKFKPVPAEPGRRRVVIMTAAQDETPLHDEFWANLEAYRRHRRADLFIGGFTYQKGLFEDHSVRAGLYAAPLVPLLRPVETRLAPLLVWCGQANILPTAANPLTGWGTHGGHSSIVVPHARIALDAVAVMPGQPAKTALSTGVATRPNYVRRNAGMKAEWHHTIGFAIAEIEPDGTHYLRNVSATADGAFQDLDTRVSAGTVETGCAVEAINWGDIHWEKLDPDMSRIGWGIDPAGARIARRSMLDALNPRFQIFHDLIDFSARNHHNRGDPVFLAARHAAGSESVEAEIAGAARWLDAASRPACLSVVVDSNHNDALLKWLRSPDGRADPANSAYWHRLNAIWHAAVRAGDAGFSPFEHALAECGARFRYVRAGESFRICEDTAPIECGLHGHAGPGGGRGSPAAYARVAPRVNAGHTHAPAIREAAYFAGLNARLDLGYNIGPSAWAHADIVTMPTGKRQIVIKTPKGWRGR